MAVEKVKEFQLRIEPKRLKRGSLRAEGGGASGQDLHH